MKAVVMNNSDIIFAAEQFVKQELQFDPSGHDWWHIERVRNLAVELATVESANLFVCELSSLLHDVADEKLNESKDSGLKKVQNWLEKQSLDEQTVDHIMLIISTMSYNGGKNPPMETIEGKIVQDADRLDALGAIGIARTFLYSGWKGQPIHIPGQDFDNSDYRSNEKTAIFHFYEKLLKIKELLNTDYAKEIANNRHDFIKTFLDQFNKEWELRDTTINN